MIRPERKQEGRTGAMLLEHTHKVGHAFARAAVGIDVDLKG